MKLSDLKIPFLLSERKPTLLGKILYVPAYYFDHQNFSFTLDKVFSQSQPVHIEFCSGNGNWIIEKAQAQKEVNFIAVERKFERAQKIWLKAQKRSLENLFIVLGDAQTFSQFYLEESSISKVYINFPDPWPKRRHAKHRLIQKEFAQMLEKILHKGAELILVTDHVLYRDQMLEVLFTHTELKSQFENPCYRTKWPDYGESYFENLWRGFGKVIYYLSFIN